MNDDDKTLYAYVSVDLSIEQLDKPFLYKIKNGDEEKIHVGDKVIFPFGKGDKLTEGYVLSIDSKKNILSNALLSNDNFLKNEESWQKIKEIEKLADKKISANSILLDIALFMSKEYFTNLSTCIKACLPVKKVIRKNSKSVDNSIKYEKTIKNIVFNDEQTEVINKLKDSYDHNPKSEHLLYGVTGSGKTEVYIELIKHVINNGKKVIVLIPEISLTYQTVIRLKQVFEEDISIINSKMSDGERYISYKKCLDGKANILVGPRSAVFAPFLDLGLIIIDEVHDHSYKQEVSPRYNTIDIARFRMEKQNAMLLTLSATPLVTHYYNALHNDNITIHKLTKRANENVTLPKIKLVDMKKEYKDKNKSSFSVELKKLIREKLDKKEQIMLFMNKRGLSRFEKCLDCGETIKCPHCDVSLVVHNDGKAKCHYCGYEEDIASCCPSCNGDHVISFGMGTEKLELKCKEEFPDAKILRMDRDTTMKKNEMDNIIRDFRNHKADILIGTQMIVKGHDFPNVTLVGIMCADMSLYMPSYKATEDTFDILTQMEGRSGRLKQGDSVIQTYDTENYAIQYAINQDYDAFYDEEILYREKLTYPPFCVLLNVIVKCMDEDYLVTLLDKLKSSIEEYNTFGLIIYGPNKCSPYKIKDIYHKNFFIKCKSKEGAYNVRQFMHDKIKELDYLKSIYMVFDIE